MKLWRKLIAVIIALLIAGLIAYGFMPKPTMVEAVRITRGDLRVTVSEEGMTREKDRYVISAPVAGYLGRIALENGAAVEAGGVVAVIGPAPSVPLDPRSREMALANVSGAAAALSAASENAKSASAQAVYAEAQQKRESELLASGFVSKDDAERAESSAKSARASYESARYNVQAASDALKAAKAVLRSFGASGGRQDAVRVTAPVAGAVLRIIKKSEGMVVPGDPIMEVGNPASLEVEVDLLSSDALRVRPGMRVLLDRRDGQPPLEGVARVVEPSGFTKISALGVEEQRVWVICDITSPHEQWKNLGDAYRLEATFIIDEGKNLLLAPEGALFQHEGGWAAFLYDDGKARMVLVKVGRRNGINAEVLGGLGEGQLVINYPDRSLTDGAKVKLR